MVAKVRFRPSASEDVASAFAWYEMEQAGLGTQFIGAMDSILSQVIERPALYRECRPGIRMAVLRRFPYLLFYLVEADEIVVVACLHSRRNPRKWPKE